jgi:hypothetical protein
MKFFLVAEHDRVPKVKADAVIPALHSAITCCHYQTAPRRTLLDNRVTQRTATWITLRRLDGTTLDG